MNIHGNLHKMIEKGPAGLRIMPRANMSDEDMHNLASTIKSYCNQIDKSNN